jgi:hypothetical protein
MVALPQKKRTHLITKKGVSNLLCGVLSLIRIKWLVLNSTALFMATCLLISSNFQIVYNILTRENFRQTTSPPELLHFRQNHSNQIHKNSWYEQVLDLADQWNFTLFWKQVKHPNPSSKFTLYMVDKGRLYCWRQHREQIAAEGDDRVQQFEELALATLARLKQNSQSSHEKYLDRNLLSIGTESMPFFLDRGDFESCRELDHPFFTFATIVKERPEDPCVPLGIPSSDFWKNYKNMDSASWDSTFMEQHQRYPWNHKINKAIWYGSSTGHYTDGQTRKDLPWVKLIHFSIHKPSLSDSGISGFSYRTKSEQRKIHDESTNSFMELEDFQRFKAIVYNDENSWSLQFMRLLCMNSVVLKKQPNMFDYSDFDLQPWVHYLPVHENMTNLEELILLTTSKDVQVQQQMQSIIRNANAWCRQKMTGLQMITDMTWIMTTYHKILLTENVKSGAFTTWRGNYFLHDSSRNSNDWMEISSNNLSKEDMSRLYQPHPSHPRQPQYYPWYNHTAGSVQQWNFKLFWKTVHQPDPKSNMPLYIVHNGNLYSWRKHQDLLKSNRNSYRERVLKFEDLILSALTNIKHYIKYGRSQNVGQSLHAIGTKSMPFFLERGDFSSCRGTSFPIFSFATFVEEDPNAPCIPLGVPSYFLWKYYKKMDRSSWDILFKKRNQKYPWARKINKAVWRGSATGHFTASQNWNDLPRAQLVQFSLSHPKLLDAGITGFAQRTKSEQQEMRANGFMKKFMKSEDFQRFKAIVDVDGNSWSSRFMSLLCMNSVVLKVQPNFVDYSYFELQPFVHYLPVHGNLSNLEEMILLVTSKNKQNQKKMQSIVRNANLWCRSKMTGLQMINDMSWIMASYHEILQSEDLKSGSFTDWRDNFFSNSSLWNEKKWVRVARARDSKVTKDSSVNFYQSFPNWKKPKYYPWYQHTAGPVQLWNFNLFWKEVTQPNATSDTPLYVVNQGRLFVWRKHQETLKAKNSERVKQYEELIKAALAEVQQETKLKFMTNKDQEYHILKSSSMPFFVDRSDFVNCRNYTYPIFTFATFQKETLGEACLPLGIPTYDIWSKYKNMDKLSWYILFKERQKRYPWTSKISKAVWRGAATGHVRWDQSWRDLPRAQLVQYSLDNPKLLDAGLKSFRQWNETAQREMLANGLKKEFMNMEDFQKYKAIVDIDGNSWSSRFVSLLCMNSVVLKVQPNMVDYSYVELQPWVHFIPIHGNLSNLEEMINFVSSKEKKKIERVQSIVRNANEWCQAKMTSSQILADMKWILMSHLEILELEDQQSGSLTKWRENYFVNDTQWNDENWVELSGPHPFLSRRPPHYPWYKHTAGPENKWNFEMFWKQVTNPNLMSNTHLYIINNGSLYGWRHHRELLKANNSEWWKKFEDLLSSTLSDVKTQIEIGSRTKTVDRRYQIIGTESIPLIVNVLDFGSCGMKPYPIITFATFAAENSVEACIPVAVPSNEVWDKYKNFSSHSWDELYRERNRKYPWTKKVNKAIWRGAAIGNGHVDHDWRDLPTAQVVLFSQINPNLLDSGFTSFSKFNETAQLEMQKSGFMKNFMQMEDFQKFKAIVDIDGNSWSSRFVSVLCMNSIVLKVVPNYVDYFFFELQPWVHYVPVHRNLSNLEEMIHLTTDISREKEMKTIVRNANNWCRQKMTGPQMMADMSWILNSYFEILQYEDEKSGSFTSWKNGYFRSNTAWNKKNWIKLH